MALNTSDSVARPYPVQSDVARQEWFTAPFGSGERNCVIAFASQVENIYANLSAFLLRDMQKQHSGLSYSPGRTFFIIILHDYKL